MLTTLIFNVKPHLQSMGLTLEALKPGKSGQLSDNWKRPMLVTCGALREALSVTVMPIIGVATLSNSSNGKAHDMDPFSLSEWAAALGQNSPLLC